MFRNRWYTGSIQKLLILCWIAILLLACSKKPQSTERPGTPSNGTPPLTSTPPPTGTPQQPGTPPSTKPGGVKKPGDLCYTISALQLWATAAAIKGDSVFSGSHIDKLDENGKNLAKAGAQIIETINEGKTVEKNEMEAFYDKLKACGWNPPIDSVEDLAELMESMYRVLKPDNYVNITPTGNSIIGSQCPDKPYILPLTLPNDNSSQFMQTLFSHFLRNNVDRFEEIPDLLMLNVNRNPDGNGKKKNEIKYLLTITINEPYTYDNEQHTYDLVAFARHCDDGTTASGHYIAYVERGEQWFQCTDHEIRKCEKIEDVIDSAENSDMYLYKKRG
ncbi:MAG: hypothetical protein MI674_00425 [Cytophagales bacterium]|nr:hypothetical protein [Cytophagales bacterium]